MTDTSKEAVERFIDRCWLTDPDPDRTETMVRALLAERDALQAKVEALHSAQSYTYIGKDGIPVLARDLEDQRDAAYAAGFEACREMAVEKITIDHGSRNGVYDKSRKDAAKIILGLQPQQKDSSDPAPTVEQAARVLLGACPNPLFDRLKPVLIGEFSEDHPFFDENGNERTTKVDVSWRVTKDIITATLRALAVGKDHE